MNKNKRIAELEERVANLEKAAAATTANFSNTSVSVPSEKIITELADELEKKLNTFKFQQEKEKRMEKARERFPNMFNDSN